MPLLPPRGWRGPGVGGALSGASMGPRQQLLPTSVPASSDRHLVLCPVPTASLNPCPSVPSLCFQPPQSGSGPQGASLSAFPQAEGPTPPLHSGDAEGLLSLGANYSADNHRLWRPLLRPHFRWPPEPRVLLFKVIQPGHQPKQSRGREGATNSFSWFHRESSAS